SPGLGPALRAQENPDAHSAHHPPAGSAEKPATGTETAPAGPAPAPSSAPNPVGGMQGMMGGMMGRPERAFYPTLMDMPRLSPEARQYIEQEAQQRLGIGAQSIAAGESALHRALGEKDAAAMQNAAAGVRQGLLLVESGAAALRALNEGQEPRQIAL